MSIHRYNLKSGIGWKAVVQISPTSQISKKFRRKIDAERWERDQATSRDRGMPLLAIRSALTLGELAERWLADYSKQRKAASTHQRDQQLLRLQILPAFGGTRITDLAPAAVEKWLTVLLTGTRPLKPKSCNHALGLLKKILNDAVRWRLLAYNPLLQVSPIKMAQSECQFWAKSEASLFLERIATTEPSRYPIFMLALNTGMRRGELLALTWDCVNFEQRQITVKASWCSVSKAIKGTKSGKIRQIPINRQLLDTLVELRRRSSSAFVLGGLDFPLNSTKEMTRLSRAAGVTPIRFHDLRHTFASHFMMSGGKIYDLQKLLGHSTIQMTERYSHLSPEHLKGTTEILGFGARELAEVVPIRAER